MIFLHCDISCISAFRSEMHRCSISINHPLRFVWVNGPMGEKRTFQMTSNAMSLNEHIRCTSKSKRFFSISSLLFFFLSFFFFFHFFFAHLLSILNLWPNRATGGDDAGDEQPFAIFLPEMQCKYFAHHRTFSNRCAAPHHASHNTHIKINKTFHSEKVYKKII